MQTNVLLVREFDLIVNDLHQLRRRHYDCRLRSGLADRRWWHVLGIDQHPDLRLGIHLRQTLFILLDFLLGLGGPGGLRGVGGPRRPRCLGNRRCFLH